MKKAGLVILFSCSLIAVSCIKEKTKPGSDLCGSTVVSYANEIVPIINTSCVTNQGPGTGCHDAWIFEYSGVVTAIENGSWFQEIFVDKTMPQIPNDFGIDSLTSDEYIAIQCWLEQGYPEN